MLPLLNIILQTGHTQLYVIQAIGILQSFLCACLMSQEAVTDFVLQPVPLN